MTSQWERASRMDGLLEIMRDLRDPIHGCPWDLKQDFSTIAPFTLEEAYELVDAIASGDDQQVEDELGDVLFQVVFYSQIADEKGLFDFDDVVEAISEKLVWRHPHVFDNPEGESISENQVKDRGKRLSPESVQRKIKSVHCRTSHWRCLH